MAFAPSSGAAEAVTAQVILERWAAGVGGRERLRAVKNTYIKARYESSSGTGIVEEWTSSRIQRRQHSQLDRGEELLVYDGTQGWTRSQGRVRALSADESAGQRTAAFIGSHAHPVSTAETAHIEYLGEDESQRNYVLRVSPEGGHPTVYYVDKTSYLPTRNQQQLPTAILEIGFEDWRELNGIKVPHRTRLTTNTGYEATETVTEIRHNNPLTAELFARPADSPADYRFVSGGSSARVSMTFNGANVLVQGRLNGSQPAWLILDTGASDAVLDLEFAQSLRMPLHGQRQLTGAGGTVQGSYARGVRLVMGDAELQNQTFTVTPLRFLGPINGQPIVGILGYSLFSRFVVEVDYDAQQITLHEPHSFRYHGSGAVLPIVLHTDQPYIKAQLSVAGRSPLEGEYVVDLGSRNTLMLASDYAAAHGITTSLAKTIRVPAAGVGGEFQMTVGRLEQLKVGPFALADPLVYFPPGEITARARAGNIGGAFLQRFRVTFDYSRERMILEPTPRLKEPEEFDMSGLRLAATTPPAGGVRVSHVLDNSPARDSGIQPGDLILKVNGRAADAIPLASLRGMLRREGAELELELQTGSSTRRLLLKLRRLI